MTKKSRLVAVTVLLVCGRVSAAYPQVPDTDIWVSEVFVHGTSVELGKPVNVTHRPGYDNQPCFLSDSQTILYTVADAAGRTDIYRRVLTAPSSVRVTQTPESEYSPTPLEAPASGFCAVRVEADSTQRLWRFNLDGSNPTPVMSDVDSVGYFAWIDPTHVAVFVLGNEKKKEPHTLRVVDVNAHTETVVARGIGRSIQRIPGTHDISFTMEGDEDHYRFFILKNGARAGVPLIDPIGNGQDAAWMGNTMLLSSGTTIYAAAPLDSKPAWKPVRDFASDGIATITRMAVAPDHSLIAFVAVRTAP
jgi:hypothetical protein